VFYLIPFYYNTTETKMRHPPPARRSPNRQSEALGLGVLQYLHPVCIEAGENRLSSRRTSS